MKEVQIIDAARKLFYKFGFKRVSMDEIASNANVTKKTVYSYFASKEELLKYFINEEIQNMKDIVEKTENNNISYFENIHNVICALLKYKKERNFLKIIIEEADSFKNTIVMENIRTVDDVIQNYIKEKIVYAQKEGYIDVQNVDVTAFLVYRLYLSLMLELDDKKFSDEVIADNIIAIIKNGIEKKN